MSVNGDESKKVSCLYLFVGDIRSVICIWLSDDSSPSYSTLFHQRLDSERDCFTLNSPLISLLISVVKLFSLSFHLHLR